MDKSPIVKPKQYTVCPTLTEYAEVFMTNFVRPRNKQSEIDKKQQILTNFLLPMLGELRLDEIDTFHIDAFIARMREAKLKPKTINNRVAVLGKLLRYAQSRKVVDRLPLIEPLKAVTPEPRFLSRVEVSTLITHVMEYGDPYDAMVLVALNTGMRKGELQALKWKNVSVTRKELRVVESMYIGTEGEPKSFAGRRTIPLNEAAVAALKGLQRLGPFVFSRPPRGAYITDHFCKTVMEDLTRRAHIRGLGWHVLRHTFASHMVMGGVPIRVVQSLLGHSDIKMTMRYSHLSPESRSDATDVLTALFVPK